MSDNAEPETPDTTQMLADMQHWTWVMGRAQQMVMEHTTRQVMSGKAQADWPKMMDRLVQSMTGADAAAANDPAALAQQSMAMWSKGLDFWNALARTGIESMDALAKGDAPTASSPDGGQKDRRFSHELWDQHPIFQTIRQSYALAAQHLMGLADKVDGLDGAEKERLRFQLKGVVDAVSPSNFVLTNPASAAKGVGHARRKPAHRP